jgi:hypothetical protein
LPWVKTAVGRALSPKGSFPARPRIRSLGQMQTVVDSNPNSLQSGHLKHQNK